MLGRRRPYHGPTCLMMYMSLQGPPRRYMVLQRQECRRRLVQQWRTMLPWMAEQLMLGRRRPLYGPTCLML
eukprot:12305662-Heterocapsa_arctica.AAC.1